MRITDMLAAALGKAIAFIPNLAAALIILVVGFFVASILGRVTQRALTAAALDRRRSVDQLVGQQVPLERLPHTGGRLVYWVAALVTVGVAVDALHLAWLSAGVARVLGYLPNLLAAGAVVAVGYLVGSFAYKQVMTRRGASLFLARIARGAIFVFAGFMALQQLGIATAIVTTAFTVVLSAMAVAGALAFGLGNRELAARITREWYERRDPRSPQYDPTPERHPEERAGDEARH